MRKNYVVVGGTSGIGYEIVRILSQADHMVFCLSRHSTNNVDHLSNVSYINWNALESFEKGGELPDMLDGLVYCPGSIELKPFKSISEQKFLEDFDLNVVGGIRILKKTIDRLKNNPEVSSVVWFSTVAVQMGMPYHSLVSSSKGAVEGLIRSLAAEYAPSVRFNAISPSLTDTPLAKKLLSTAEKYENMALRHPMKRIGSPEEVAQMAVYLLSDKSSWVTGQVWHIDGGMRSLK